MLNDNGSTNSSKSKKRMSVRKPSEFMSMMNVLDKMKEKQMVRAESVGNGGKEQDVGPEHN